MWGHPSATRIRHSVLSIYQRVMREEDRWCPDIDGVSRGTKTSFVQLASLVDCRVKKKLIPVTLFVSCVHNIENSKFCKKESKFLRFLSDKMYCILQCHIMWRDCFLTMYFIGVFIKTRLFLNETFLTVVFCEGKGCKESVKDDESHISMEREGGIKFLKTVYWRLWNLTRQVKWAAGLL